MSLLTIVQANKEIWEHMGSTSLLGLQETLRTRFEELFSTGVSLLTATADAEQTGAFVSVPANSRGVAGLVLWEGVLAAAETLTVLWNLQDATDGGGTGAADFGALQTPGVVATGAGTFRGFLLVPFNTTGIRSHLAMQLTLTTSAVGTVLGAGALLFNDPSDLLVDVSH